MRTWHTAVGVDVDEGLLLDLGERKRVVLVGDSELFQDQNHFPRIGAGSYERVSN